MFESEKVFEVILVQILLLLLILEIYPFCIKYIAYNEHNLQNNEPCIFVVELQNISIKCDENQEEGNQEEEWVKFEEKNSGLRLYLYKTLLERNYLHWLLFGFFIY